MKIKNLIAGLTLALAVAGCASENVQEAPSQAVESEVTVDTTQNVGNGLGYAYTVTDISEREMQGTPLNYESDGNKGLMLYLDEIGFEVELGDEIIVVWGEYEDEFLSIERAVQTEDGTYVGESFYK